MAVAVADLELTPSLEEVRELAREHRSVPLRHTFIADCETPVSAYLKLRGDGPSFLLESAEQGQQVGRWSFLGFRPRAVIRLDHGEHPDPYAAVDEELARYRIAPLDGPAAVRRRRRGDVRLRPRPQRGAEHRRAEPRRRRHAGAGRDGHGRAARVRPPAPRGDRARQRRVREERRGARVRGGGRGHRRGARAAGGAGAAAGGGSPRAPEFTSNLGGDGYAEAVERAKEYIRAGDVYQVVPSQRWSADCPVDAFSIYRGLRAINPSPYMYFLDFEDFEIAGASPEALVTVTGRTVRQRPIAGTRPRADSVEQDLQHGRELLADPKERAEHVMLVDLGRNDLGRVCEYGSVSVEELMAVETYSHVMHIVSSVSGTLARGRVADGRAARVAAGGHAVGRAEDPRDADHRRARAGGPRPLRRRGGLPLVHRRPRHLHLHPLRARQGRARAHPGRRRDRRGLGARATRCARPRPRPAR